MLNLRRLLLLDRYAQLGSIAAVAAEIGYSTSAVSQQLTRLEKETGVTLLERTARSSALTAAGRTLVEHAARIRAEVEAAETSLHNLGDALSGTYAVSCIPGLASDLAPVLARLQQEHPGLRIIAHEAGSRAAAQAVIRAEGDLAVVDDWGGGGLPREANLDARTLTTDPVVLAVPIDHPLTSVDTARVTARRLADALATTTWICASQEQMSRAAGDRLLDRLGLAPARRWEFDGLHVQSALVSSGTGMALLPAWVADSEPGVAALVPPYRLQRRLRILTRRSARGHRALRTIARAIAGAVDDIVPGG